MANDGDDAKSDGPRSIRRRLTNSLKRVMTIGSRRSSKSGFSSTPSLISPQLATPALETPVLKTPVLETPILETPVLETPSAIPASPSAAVSPPPPRAAANPSASRSPVYRSPSRNTPTMAVTSREKNRTPLAHSTIGSPPPRMMPAQRAEALFKKHGADINVTVLDWPVPAHTDLQRVYKEIRMKVHRTCHKCQTVFTNEHECRTCGHHRCKACSRHPVKKSKPKDKGKGKEKITPKPPAGHKRRPYKDPYGLTLANRWGGPDLVYKPIRQRIHRFCHRCEQGFNSEKICTNCKHTRCKKCPRLPKKGDKPEQFYNCKDPDDSGSDRPKRRPRTYRRPRLRVHWTCQKCYSTFLEKNYMCPGCGAKREDSGKRDPPKKHRPRLHPHHSQYKDVGGLSD